MEIQRETKKESYLLINQSKFKEAFTLLSTHDIDNVFDLSIFVKDGISSNAISKKMITELLLHKYILSISS